MFEFVSFVWQSGLTADGCHCLLRTLGTPNNDVWPDVENLPDYKNTFPKWKSVNLSSMVKNLDKNGLDLLGVRDTSGNVTFSILLFNLTGIDFLNPYTASDL